MRSSYKLMGLYYRRLSARIRLVSSATSNASYCLRYWEKQLGKTTHNPGSTEPMLLTRSTKGVATDPRHISSSMAHRIEIPTATPLFSRSRNPTVLMPIPLHVKIERGRKYGDSLCNRVANNYTVQKLFPFPVWVATIVKFGSRRRRAVSTVSY